MNNPILFKLIEEVRLQCRFGKLAFDHLRTSLQAADPEKTFFYVQALLHQAGCVSRLLWPSRPESAERGQRLRTALNVTEASPVRLRELRPRLEASDEHLEDWLASLETPGHMEFNIMPQGSLTGYKQDTFQRSLDPDTFKLAFRGDACDLRRLADELHRLEAAAQSWLRTHNPW